MPNGSNHTGDTDDSHIEDRILMSVMAIAFLLALVLVLFMTCVSRVSKLDRAAEARCNLCAEPEILHAANERLI